jgi:hypothetical protein
VLPKQYTPSPGSEEFSTVFLSRARGKGREATGHPAIRNQQLAHCVCTTADKADVKVLGTTDTHAISRWEELLPISIPRHGTATVVVNGAIYIPGGGLLLATGDC